MNLRALRRETVGLVSLFFAIVPVVVLACIILIEQVEHSPTLDTLGLSLNLHFPLSLL